MKKNTFKVLFYIRGNQINKEGKAPIMIRITIDGEVEQLNSKLTIELSYGMSQHPKQRVGQPKYLNLTVA